MNTKAKVALRKPYGFKTDEVYETVLYHELARLPEHDLPTHSVNEATV